MRTRFGIILVVMIPLLALAFPARGAWVFERLTDNSSVSTRPDIVLSSSNIHLVWDDLSFGNSEIFYKRSTNNGGTWSFQRLSDNSGVSNSPAAAVVGNNGHVVWQDDSYGTQEIFYKRGP